MVNEGIPKLLQRVFAAVAVGNADLTFFCNRGKHWTAREETRTQLQPKLECVLRG